MSAKNFVIYRSSAGSGKTYTLTKEYLKLALKYPYYYKHILAVTFTNKAMQEMKDRIISKLDEFAHGRLDGMGEELLGYTGYDRDFFIEKSRQVLTNILHGYSHFAISTIDSFFQRVIRSFAKELGLAGSYRLELNYELILIQIVDDLLLEATDDKRIRNWLIQFARESLQEGNNWDVRREIRSLAQEIFNEHFKPIEEEVAQHDRNLTSDLKTALDEAIYTFEGKMDNLGKAGLDILKQYGLTVADFRGGKTGVMNHLTKIRKEVKKYEPTSTLNKVLNNEMTWYAGKSDRQAIMDEALGNGLEALMREAVEYYEQQFRLYITAVQLKKFIYGYGLLADLNRKLQEYKRENDVLLISDATRFLKELVTTSDTPFVYEKVGSFFKHYLIDEFQDTSGFQWDSFRPLVDDSLAQGYKNLVVGDIKQSIYRWRGGDWELLLNRIESDIGELRTEHKKLAVNYRSETRIIGFNNSLFAHMPRVMASLVKNDTGNSTQWQMLEQVYEDTRQDIPEGKAEGGYVNVTFLADEEGFGWKEKVGERLPVLIEELQDKGVALKDIAILVRRNREGKDIADILSAYEHSGQAKEGYRYDVISNESLFLSASSAVRTVVFALKFLHDPFDKVVAAELIYEYQRKIRAAEVKLNSWMSSVADQQVEKWLPATFLEQKQELLYLPFYELIERLIELFEVNKLPGQYAYLQTFQDLILKFTQNEKGDVASFLDWWEERANRESIKVADDLDAIRILTIHKSKGLEYRSVIVPFCNWEIDHKPKPPTLIWADTDKPPFNVGHLPLIYKKDLANTFYEEQYEIERLKAHLDNLNILYVALTRAAHNLWVFAPDNDKDVAKIVYHTIDDGDFELKSYWDSKQRVFEYGSREFHFEEEATSIANGVKLEAYNHFNWRNKITVKQSGKDFAEADEKRAKINYGILIHKLLSRIEILQDKQRVIDSLYYEEGLNAEQKREIERVLDDLLANETARHWFAGHWKVYNEVSILTPDEEYRPDRVITDTMETLIIDYKTGVKKDADRRQMAQYIELLQAMDYRNVRGFLWYLRENEIEEIG